MVAWRYFIQTRTGRARETISRTFMRLRPDEPLLFAEVLRGDGTWHRDDRLFRERMLGADYDFIEVARKQFFDALGDRTIASDESFDRPTVDEFARLSGLETAIGSAWRAVPVPPGAETLTLDSFGDSNTAPLSDDAR